MDEKENTPEEFTLEDIMKEFGADADPAKGDPEPSEEASEHEETCEDPVVEVPSEEIPEPISPEEETQSTDAKDSSEDDTIRLSESDEKNQAPEETDEETKSFAPVEEVADKTDSENEIPEGAEPFSDGWEPQYDQPIGEYVPPEPIVFRPRSQLHQLKRKLVAGPERRFYALSEIGTGKLQISIFLSLLVVVLSVTALCMHRFGLVQENRMRLLVFGELFAMMFSALLASGRLIDGVAAVFKRKFTLDSLLTVTFAVCLADGYFCLKEVRVPFCAAFCLEVTMSLWAELQRRNIEIAEMDTLRKATRLNRVAKAPECYEGRPGFYVTNGELEDFMDHYQNPSGTERMLRSYALLALLVSTAIAAVTAMSQGISNGLQVWSASILASCPISIFICQSRPMAILERRLHKVGTVLCGWSGVKAGCGSASVPLRDRDLFPAGSVKINGVKFYTSRDPDLVISYATALITLADNCFSDLFQQLLDDRSGRHYDVAHFRSYEKGGLGGEICGESVLVGTIEFLKDMGVEVPDGTRVNQAVYMAIDGNLAAVYALAFGKLKGVTAGLGTLCSYRGLTPVLTSDNFLLSQNFVRAKFGVNIRRFAFPALPDRKKLSAWTPDPEQSITCALTTQDSLPGFAFAVTGSRNLRTACRLGAIFHIFGGIVGILIVLALTFVQGSSLLTPLNLLLFELVWLVPGFLVTEWTRSI